MFFYQITTAQLKVLGRRLPIEKYAIAAAKPHSGHTTSADAEVGKDVSMQFDMTVLKFDTLMYYGSPEAISCQIQKCWTAPAVDIM